MTEQEKRADFFQRTGKVASSDPHGYASYLAGQASTGGDNMYFIKACESYRERIAELERERDEAVNALRLRMMQIADLKAQVGEPECPLCNARATLAQTEVVGRQIDALLNPTIEQVKAQVGEPVAWAIYISGEPSDVFMHKQFAELECARRDKLYPDPTRQFVPLFTHPTTERPYNPLNDYAVISMNPTTERRDRYYNALLSISKNTCCGSCQEAKQVALKALNEGRMK